ncbi:MAG: hypothetical protein PHN88_12795 [Ignavibacteria bacterium]|nr:hypothetical protein [Ignavibacteria bacterium]
MKYFYYLFIAFAVLYGCSSSKSDEKNMQDMQKLKRSTDSLNAVKLGVQKTLDSLNAESKRKDDLMKQYQMQLDSLQKNMNGNN